MTDPIDVKSIPGTEAMTNSFAATAKSFQGLAAELQRMSKESLDHTTQTAEKLRGAKTMQEVIAIQTSYLQEAFAAYTENAKRFSELMMSVPMELAKQGRTAFQEGTAAAKKATEQVGEQFGQHNG
jgi:phasin family protein